MCNMLTRYVSACCVQEHRGTGHAICSAGARLGAFFSPYLVVSTLSVECIGAILGLINVAAAAAVWLLPETAGNAR